MNKYIIMLIAALTSVSTFAQAPAAPMPATFIKGTIDIRYPTRTQLNGDKPKDGVEDVYTLNINVSNIAQFRGTITQLPYIDNLTEDQKGKLTFGIETDVFNPKNVAQVKTVGKITGIVPVSEQNVYSFSEGSAKIGVFATGKAEAFESAFKGTALGKPPVPTGMFQRIKNTLKERINISKTVNGKTMTITLTDYDQMVLQGHVLPAGPARACSEATVNGTFTYDYVQKAWFLQGVTVSYVGENGRVQTDTLTGNMRWSDEKDQYDFDIRVNEPVGGAGDMFAAASTSDDFFAVDTTLAALTGKMTYQEVKSGNKVASQSVVIDLKGNQLTNYQVLYLGKLFFLTMTVPLNSE